MAKSHTFKVNMLNTSEAQLTWNANSQTSIGNIFEIERKIHGEISFSKVGKVIASLDKSSFAFVDRLPSTANAAYYRLKVVGTDKIAYSDIKKVDRKVKNLVDFYPSTVQNDIKLQFQNERGENSKAEVKIYDLMGRLLKQETLNIHQGYNSLTYDLSRLNAGTYLLKVAETSNQINNTFKFVKQD